MHIKIYQGTLEGNGYFIIHPLTSFRQDKLSATEAVISDLESEMSSSDPQQKKAAGLEKYYVVQSSNSKAQPSTKKE